MLKTSREVFATSSFKGQIIVSALINFGINFGIAWAVFSSWGKRGHDYDSWEQIYAFQWVDSVSPLWFDLLLTCTFMGFFSVVLGTGGAMKEVKNRKCPPMDPAVTTRGFWRFTPVRVPGLFFRGLLTGIYFFIVAGLPTLLLLWAVIKGGALPGFDYTIFKGIWALFLSMPITCCVFFAAIDARNFPELELESLLAAGGGMPGAAPGAYVVMPGGGMVDTARLAAPPLVGNPGFV